MIKKAFGVSRRSMIARRFGALALPAVLVACSGAPDQNTMPGDESAHDLTVEAEGHSTVLSRSFQDATQERSLSFYNTHTRETLEVSYWTPEGYDLAARRKIDRLLRDHRSDTSTNISSELLDLLHDLKLGLEARYPGQDIIFHVISGYRSPETNAAMRARGGGQARRSRHMHGDAIDIRVPGISTKEIRNMVWCMQRGGVGYYRRKDFVHVDTHRVRYWNWSPTDKTCTSLVS